MNKRQISLVFAMCTAVMIGCGPQEPKEEFLGETAMTFGSTPESKTLGGFVLGKWGYVTGSMKPMSGPVTNIMEFKQDGSLVFKKDGFKFGGTWKDMGEFVQVTYLTLQDKPLDKALEDFRKAAEKGTQGSVKDDLFSEWASSNLDKMTELRLAEDKKQLVFGAKAPEAVATGNASMDGFMNNMNAAMVAMNSLGRIGVKK